MKGTNMRILTFLVAMIVMSLFYFDPAFAQDSRVNVGELISPWLQIIVGAAASLLVALAGWATALLQKKTGIQIEEKHMLTLQSALTNAAGKLVTTTAGKLNTVSVDVKSPALASAIHYVNASAADAVKHFGLDERRIADMILNKLGVITAPSVNTTPTTGNTL